MTDLPNPDTGYVWSGMGYTATVLEWSSSFKQSSSSTKLLAYVSGNVECPSSTSGALNRQLRFTRGAAGEALVNMIFS